MADGSEVSARSVIIATGVTWRRLGVPALEALVGAGVFYGAAGAEAAAVTGQHVFVVGAGNSARQAALHLAKYAATVTILVRGSVPGGLGPGLHASMSEYLVTEISKTANIIVRPATEVIDGGGRGRLETLTLRNRPTGATGIMPAAALFVMIGTQPLTPVARRQSGARPQWVYPHRPGPEPGRPASGQLAAGAPAAAAGNKHPWRVRRRGCAVPIGQTVASAIGEGAIAVQLLHDYLWEEKE